MQAFQQFPTPVCSISLKPESLASAEILEPPSQKWSVKETNFDPHEFTLINIVAVATLVFNKSLPFLFNINTSAGHHSLSFTCQSTLSPRFCMTVDNKPQLLMTLFCTCSASHALVAIHYNISATPTRDNHDITQSWSSREMVLVDTLQVHIQHEQGI